MDVGDMERVAVRVSLVTILINVLLTAFKLAAGFFAHSSAMISDGIHTASDVISTLIVLIGVKLAARKSDKSHPYGHERFESVAAIVLSPIVIATGAGIGYDGVMNIVHGDYLTAQTPGLLALIAAAVSILVMESLYWYARFHAKRVESDALMADAWHHRADSLSSIGSFVGILIARLGFPIFDPLASIVICLLILKAGYDIFKEAISKMTDKSCDDTTVAELKTLILGQEGVLGIDRLDTRLFGNRIYVEAEIQTDGALTLLQAHAIAERTHDAIEAGFPKVKHCMVHVNPYIVNSDSGYLVNP